MCARRPISVSIRILSPHERKCLWKLHLDHVILIDLISQVCLCIFLCSHTWSVCPSNLVAVVEAHAAQSWQLGLQTVVSRLLLLLLVVELLPLDLLPHAPRLLDGLHHRVLVPKQRCGVEAGQDVWVGRRMMVCHFDWQDREERQRVCGLDTRGQALLSTTSIKE